VMRERAPVVDPRLLNGGLAGEHLGGSGRGRRGRYRRTADNQTAGGVPFNSSGPRDHTTCNDPQDCRDAQDCLRSSARP
jgi:hypothetical protein